MLGQIKALILGALSPLLVYDHHKEKDVIPGDGFSRFVKNSPAMALRGQGDVMMGYGRSIDAQSMSRLFDEVKTYEFPGTGKTAQ